MAGLEIQTASHDWGSAENTEMAIAKNDEIYCDNQFYICAEESEADLWKVGFKAYATLMPGLYPKQAVALIANATRTPERKANVQ